MFRKKSKKIDNITENCNSNIVQSKIHQTSTLNKDDNIANNTIYQQEQIQVNKKSKYIVLKLCIIATISGIIICSIVFNILNHKILENTVEDYNILPENVSQDGKHTYINNKLLIYLKTDKNIDDLYNYFSNINFVLEKNSEENNPLYTVIFDCSYTYAQLDSWESELLKYDWVVFCSIKYYSRWMGELPVNYHNSNSYLFQKLFNTLDYGKCMVD